MPQRPVISDSVTAIGFDTPAPAFRYSRDPDRFVREIHRAGYATSPTYATNLITIMRRYGLYRYDR